MQRALGSFCLMLTTVSAPAQLKTIEDRLTEFCEPVRARLEPDFRAAGLPYPPRRVTLIGIKQDRALEVYAEGDNKEFRFIRSYPVLAASGRLGPKLREGDEQVPEGIYRIRELNPNSLFHLSIWLNYPNGADRLRAIVEHRSNLGGEIMIHGNAVSKGCLAMGDEAAEDLFVLAALTGIENVSVILTPVDFRKGASAVLPNERSIWAGKLHAQIKREIFRYPTPKPR